jgi:hypothetical protein
MVPIVLVLVAIMLGKSLAHVVALPDVGEGLGWHFGIGTCEEVNARPRDLESLQQVG